MDADAGGGVKLASVDDPPAVVVHVGGQVFAHYGVDLTTGSDAYNEFALDRSRLTIGATLAPHLAALLSVDADRLAVSSTGIAPDTKLRLYVRNAWLGVNNLPASTEIRAGMIDTPFTSYSEAIVGDRFITPSFGEQIGWLHPADVGVGVLGHTSDRLLDWNAVIVNGEGYDHVELDGGKTGQARVTIDPWGAHHNVKIPLSFFGSYATDPGAPIAIFGAGLGYQSKLGTAWYEFLGRTTNGTTQLGYCGTDLFGTHPIGYLMLRWGHTYLDLADKDAIENRLTAGVLKEFGRSLERPAGVVTASLTWEALWTGGPLVNPTHGVYLRSQATF